MRFMIVIKVIYCQIYVIRLEGLAFFFPPKPAILQEIGPKKWMVRVFRR